MRFSRGRGRKAVEVLLFTSRKVCVCVFWSSERGCLYL